MQIAPKGLLYKKITEEKLKNQQNVPSEIYKKNDRMVQKSNSNEDLINNLLANEKLSEDAAAVLMVKYFQNYYLAMGLRSIYFKSRYVCMI